MSTLVKKIVWQWDRVGAKLWANMFTANDQLIRVGFPLGMVAMTFDEELGKCGLECPAMVGDYESVDGFLSRVKRAASGAVRSVKKSPAVYTRAMTRGFVPKAVFDRVAPVAVRRAQQRLARTAVQYQSQAMKYGARYGMAAARSKQLGAGLGVAAVAFPAVGGPALGAWVAANRAVTVYDQAQAARRALQAGSRDPRAAAMASRGLVAQQAMQRLPALAQSDPRARLAIRALQSIPTRPDPPYSPGYPSPYPYPGRWY